MVSLRLRAGWLIAWMLTVAGLAVDPAFPLYQGFRHPPPGDSPHGYWNGPLCAAETRRQIRAMIAQGVHEAIVFPWNGMQPAYQSEAYWKQFGAALEIARQEGFTLNLADEYLWPSEAGGGLNLARRAIGGTPGRSAACCRQRPSSGSSACGTWAYRRPIP